MCIFKIFIAFILCVCVCTQAHTQVHAITRVTARGQLSGAIFLLSHGSRGENLGCQVWCPHLLSRLISSLGIFMKLELGHYKS